MKKSNRKKGFTLVELIIVMAIFGIIMLGVMKIADPLARVMERSSSKEKNAAYVDNISEYLDSALRYSKYMYVYVGEQSDHVFSNDPSESNDPRLDFLMRYYNGCISRDATGTLMAGKLHVLQLINETSYEASPGNVQNITIPGDPTAEVEPGQIWDSVYSFTCGAYYKDEDGNYKNAATGDYNEIAPFVIDDYDSPISCQQVVNPEHFKDNNYYYSYGYATFDKLSEDDAEVAAEAVTDSDDPFGLKSNREYYSRINRQNIINGVNRFALSIVSYKHDCFKMVDGHPTFKSPSYMNAVSMYLINADMIHATDADNRPTIDLRVSRNTDGSSKTDGDKIAVEAIEVGSPFKKYPVSDLASTSTSNITFIYVVPSELYLN